VTEKPGEPGKKNPLLAKGPSGGSKPGHFLTKMGGKGDMPSDPDSSASGGVGGIGGSDITGLRSP